MTDTYTPTSTDPSPYTGGTSYGTATTGGAGLGNKTSQGEATDLSTEHQKTRLGSHNSTGAYSGGTEYGSGTTGGVGYGNKTGNYGDKHDSTSGKLLEKAGTALHSGKLREVGRERRMSAGFTEEAPAPSTTMGAAANSSNANPSNEYGHNISSVDENSASSKNNTTDTMADTSGDDYEGNEFHHSEEHEHDPVKDRRPYGHQTASSGNLEGYGTKAKISAGDGAVS